MDTSTELLIFLNTNKSSRHTSSYSINASPSLCNIKRSITKNNMDENNEIPLGFEIAAANITVGNNINNNNIEKEPSESSFSSYNETRRSLLGETSSPIALNLKDDELVVNNEMLKELFLNILERLDKSEILNEAIIGKINDANKAIDDINIKYALAVKNNSVFKNEYDELHDKIFDMDCRIIQNEQYSRRESIVISGIPENVTQKDLEPIVLNIFHAIGLNNVSSYEITACHRLNKRKSDKYPARTIVRFTNRKAVDYCLNNKKMLINAKKKS